MENYNIEFQDIRFNSIRNTNYYAEDMYDAIDRFLEDYSSVDVQILKVIKL